MTVIFSSMMEAGFGAGWMAVAGAGAVIGVVLAGLVFSLVVG
jgi:hypothetical protein